MHAARLDANVVAFPAPTFPTTDTAARILYALVAEMQVLDVQPGDGSDNVIVASSIPDHLFDELLEWTRAAF